MNRRNAITAILTLPFAGMLVRAEIISPRKTTRLQTIKEEAEWGTYGKGGWEHCRGTCPQHQLRIVRLVDCTTDHLQAIIRMCRLPEDYFVIISSILDDRGV